MPDLIIACLSQKGGVGKSTIARLIAHTYAAAGWIVKIADFNTTQLTSVKWGRLRDDRGLAPAIQTQPYMKPTGLAREQVDLVVADGRPDSDQSSLEIARIANLVIVPTGLSLDDLEPQLLFARELVAKGVPAHRVLFVLNKTTDSPSAVTDARSYLSEFAVAEHDLLQRISYQRAQNEGRALTEVDHHIGHLASQATSLAAEIVTRINTLEEQTA